MGSNCICLDYDNGPSVIREEIVRARKPHRCVECREEIPVGAMHERATGCWEGSWSTFRTCARCANVRRDYFTCGFQYGAVADDFMSAHGFDYRDGIPAGFAPCGTKKES